MYGAFAVKVLPQGAHLFSWLVSLFDLTARFFAPTRSFLWSSRTGAVRAGRLFGGHRRLGLDGSEHVGTLGAVGMTIKGEPAFRARINRATTLYSVGPGTRTMMQPCASAAKLRSGGPILPLGMKAMSHLGTPPPRTVIGDPSSVRTGPKLSDAFSVLRSLCRT